MKKKDTPIQNDGADQPMDTENSGEKTVQDEGATVSGRSLEDTAGGDKDQDADNGEENQESGDADDNEDSEPELPKILTAICPILYLSHQYKVGEELPANDPGMVEAWTAAGTAAWLPVREPAAKAKPRTAEPGLPGQAAVSESEDGDNLAGKIPKTSARKG
ncbi:MAG: hypothetical protein NC305_18585 [Lachnospiraceae bacterium]|nr:hypothetical protein [Lachnospiraceae bacterium]